jgi:micrococcal nuclease
VRLIGIDAPEIDDYCFENARQRLISLISGKTIYMEKDVSDTDQYQRLLRYIYVDETFVNFTLVDEGYAWAVTYPPDTRYSFQLAAAERSARENRRGCLWNGRVLENSRGYLEIGCFIDTQITKLK